MYEIYLSNKKVEKVLEKIITQRKDSVEKLKKVNLPTAAELRGFATTTLKLA